jgi:hypothetical protein
MGRPVGELLGGTSPLHAEVKGPDLWTVILSGLAAFIFAFFIPSLSPVAAAAWLVLLAAHLRIHVSGGGTPPISSRELAEWMVFYNMEPWGAEVEDWRTGMVASVIANVNRDPKKRKEPYNPDDFIPKRVQEIEPQTPDEQSRIMGMWGRVWDQKFGGSK